MKKTITISMLILLVLSCLTLVSAKTIIGGKIYNADFTATIPGADVTVTCNGNDKTTTSLSDGSYSVTYNETEQEGDNWCGDGDTLSVDAEKDGLSGSETGTIHDDVVESWDIGIVNVPLVPEFGLFIGTLTLLSALGILYVVRKQ